MTTITTRPREAALRHPTLRQEHESLRPFGTLHGLDPEPLLVHRQPFVERVVLVLRIGEDHSSSRGNRDRSSCPSTCGAVAPSSAEAAVTTTAISNPKVSTTTCRFLPLTFLPASYPR